MYERFTDRARKVMQMANQEAMRFNHEYIGTEHILLGIIKEDSGIAANVLKNLDIDLRKVRRQIEQIILGGPKMVPMGNLHETPKVKKVIEYAIDEARAFNHNYVGTEHMLLGLLRENEGVAAVILNNFGLKLEDARQQIRRLLGIELSSELPKSVRKPDQPDLEAELQGLSEEIRKAVKEIDAEIERLQLEKEEAITATDFDKAAQLRDRQVKMKKECELLIRDWREKS